MGELGGEKGRERLKMSLPIVNPNSDLQLNTCVFAVFKGSFDSVTNLKAALGSYEIQMIKGTADTKKRVYGVINNPP